MPLRQLFPDSTDGPSTDIKPEVDIIAVHGLNPKSKPKKDHAWDTWRTPAGDAGRLWLRDDLPTVTPSARVLLYEYDATAVYGHDRSSFCDKANRFLEDIRVEREEHPTRPLILLGHSLGGLLIEQSLINTFNTSDTQYRDILGATTGLAFFATPHFGGSAGLVAAGAVASKIASMLGFKKGDEIIQTLENGSLFTDLLQEHLRHRLDKFDIISFWGAMDNVVDKKSSRFGLSGNRERQITLDADHSSICRFGEDERDQDNLKVVKSNIKLLYSGALAVTHPLEQDLLHYSFEDLLKMIHEQDRNAERVLDRTGAIADGSISSVSSTQAQLYQDLALVLALTSGATYLSSGLPPVMLAAGSIGVFGLRRAYMSGVDRNDRRLSLSVAELREASSHIERELLDAHRRTNLLRQYEELEKERERLQQERENHELCLRREREQVDAARKLHERSIQLILAKAVEANERLAEMQKNQEEANAVTSGNVGWLPIGIFTAVKSFLAYLARWSGFS